MSAAAGAAIAAAIANAVKASGVVVRLEPEDFMKVLGRIKEPLVLYNKGGLFTTKHQYLVSYKGFAFYTRTSTEIFLPAAAEVITVRSIWLPS